MTLHEKFEKSKDIVIKIAGVVAALSGIAGAYVFYINYIWKPNIVIKNIDYSKGVAELTINGKPNTIYGTSTFYINGGWGVRFGTTYKDTVDVYDRLELIRNNMVVEYLKT